MQNQQPTTPPSQSQPVTVNQQPRARFQMDATRIRLHRDLVDSQPFQIGSDFAMLQFAGWLATQVSDSNSAMAVGYQLLGAYSYLATLKSLAEIPKVPARIDNANLDHSRS